MSTNSLIETEPSVEELRLILDGAIEVSIQAGEVISNAHREAIQMDWGSATNYKTVIDDQIDNLLRTELLGRFPDYGILSEEGEDIDGTGGYTWVVDALDGTISWRSGVTDNYSVSIGLVHSGQTIAGVVNCPGRNQIFSAVNGGGAFLNDEKVSVLDKSGRSWNKTLVAFGGGKEGPDFKRSDVVPYFGLFYEPAPGGVTEVMSTACSSVPLCLVASGQLGLAVYLSLEDEDMAAATVILREAGAIVTNLSGDTWTFGDKSIVAGHPDAHLEFMQRSALIRREQFDRNAK